MLHIFFDIRKQELTLGKHFVVTIVPSLVLMLNTLVNLKSMKSYWNLEFLNSCSNFVLILNKSI